MRIGRVAGLANVSVDTVRFYERRGLIGRPSRSLSGYRDFSERAVHEIRFVQGARKLGFTLREIEGLLATRIDRRTCDSLMTRTEAKLAEIDAKIRELRGLRRSVQRAIDRCHERPPETACPGEDSLRRARSGA